MNQSVYGIGQRLSVERSGDLERQWNIEEMRAAQCTVDRVQVPLRPCKRDLDAGRTPGNSAAFQPGRGTGKASCEMLISGCLAHGDQNWNSLDFSSFRARKAYWAAYATRSSGMAR